MFLLKQMKIPTFSSLNTWDTQTLTDFAHIYSGHSDPTFEQFLSVRLLFRYSVRYGILQLLMFHIYSFLHSPMRLLRPHSLPTQASYCYTSLSSQSVTESVSQ